MNEILLLAQLLFSETKDPEDAKAIAWVVKNRLARPKRFGATLEDVVYAPKQFSGVGSNEWSKITTNKLTDKEQKIYKKFLQIAGGVWTEQTDDPTSGADHYFNPKLANPSWAKEMEKVLSTSSHDYYKE